MDNRMEFLREKLEVSKMFSEYMVKRISAQVKKRKFLGSKGPNEILCDIEKEFDACLKKNKMTVNDSMKKEVCNGIYTKLNTYKGGEQKNMLQVSRAATFCYDDAVNKYYNEALIAKAKGRDAGMEL